MESLLASIAPVNIEPRPGGPPAVTAPSACWITISDRVAKSGVATRKIVPGRDQRRQQDEEREAQGKRDALAPPSATMSRWMRMMSAAWILLDPSLGRGEGRLDGLRQLLGCGRQAQGARSVGGGGMRPSRGRVPACWRAGTGRSPPGAAVGPRRNPRSRQGRAFARRAAQGAAGALSVPRAGSVDLGLGAGIRGGRDGCARAAGREERRQRPRLRRCRRPPRRASPRQAPDGGGETGWP